MEFRYRKEESLIGLDIIELKKGGKDIKLYGITPFGQEVVENIRKRR